ncbi:MAG TPA: prepilin-type N-terminal cleavage/methylation domain-containing protein [Byssovorax sp.]
MTTGSSRAAKRSRRRGFTLIELLAAVAIMGILAAIGIYSMRRYLNVAQSSEATAMIQNIRAAEESYKAETLTYWSCSSSLASLYPNTAPNSHSSAWVNAGHSDYAKWKTLNVSSDGPVRFGYSAVAGNPGDALPTDTALNPQPSWPATANANPWYVVQAVGDRDDNGIQAVFVGSSIGGEIMVMNPSE